MPESSPAFTYPDQLDPEAGGANAAPEQASTLAQPTHVEAPAQVSPSLLERGLRVARRLLTAEINDEAVRAHKHAVLENAIRAGGYHHF